jgi:hypothetical protein
VAALLQLAEARQLSRQRLADEHLIAPPFDRPGRATRRTLWSASYQGSPSRCDNCRFGRHQCVAGDVCRAPRAAAAPRRSAPGTHRTFRSNGSGIYTVCTHFHPTPNSSPCHGGACSALTGGESSRASFRHHAPPIPGTSLFFVACEPRACAAIVFPPKAGYGARIGMVDPPGLPTLPSPRR